MLRLPYEEFKDSVQWRWREKVILDTVQTGQFSMTNTQHSPHSQILSQIILKAVGSAHPPQSH